MTASRSLSPYHISFSEKDHRDGCLKANTSIEEANTSIEEDLLISRLHYGGRLKKTFLAFGTGELANSRGYSTKSEKFLKLWLFRRQHYQDKDFSWVHPCIEEVRIEVDSSIKEYLLNGRLHYGGILKTCPHLR